MGINFYKRAIDRAMSNMIGEAFDDYIKAFLPRLSTSRKAEKEFIAFYRYQLSEYLCSKNNYLLSLAEGDMISDLILDTYDEFMEEIASSPFRLTRSGIINLLSEVEIIFPSHNETEYDDELLIVSK